MYIIQNDNWFFKKNKSYQQYAGYLDKKHPKRTNQYTIYRNEAMRFDTVYDAIAVKDAYNVIGGLLLSRIQIHQINKKTLRKTIYVRK